MKKKSLKLSKLSLNKETITDLNNDAQNNIKGGITGKVCPPVSGTGCGCDMATCGIIICTAAGCASSPNDCVSNPDDCFEA